MAHQSSSNKGSPSGGQRQDRGRQQQQLDQTEAGVASNRTTSQSGKGTSAQSGSGLSGATQQSAEGSSGAERVGSGAAQPGASGSSRNDRDRSR